VTEEEERAAAETAAATKSKKAKQKQRKKVGPRRTQLINPGLGIPDSVEGRIRVDFWTPESISANPAFP